MIINNLPVRLSTLLPMLLLLLLLLLAFLSNPLANAHPQVEGGCSRSTATPLQMCTHKSKEAGT